MDFAQVVYSDLYEIRRFQPDGWPDIVPWFKFYIDSEFCMPIKAMINNKIAGIGTCIFYSDTAWLAHIIVSPENRNKGIGFKIVQKLLEFKKLRPINSVLLIATELGLPVYLKAGFLEVAEYWVYKKEKPMVKYPKSPDIVAFKDKYRKMVFDLDSHITGEDRRMILSDHLSDSMICLHNNKVKGLYVPGFGEGLIVATNENAGIELMKLKYAKIDKAVLPSDNTNAIEFLDQNGFVKSPYFAIRMIFGDDLKWSPEKIYSRIGGNFG